MYSNMGTELETNVEAVYGANLILESAVPIRENELEGHCARHARHASVKPLDKRLV